MSSHRRRITAEPSLLHDPVTRPFDPRALAIMDERASSFGEARSIATLAADDIRYTRHFGTDGDDRMIGSAAHEVFHMQQGGNDVVDGGAGDDGFYFGASWATGDRVIGGAGNDQLGLKGNYGLTGFAADAISGIETLVLLTGTRTDYGTPGDEHYSYRIRTHDANIAAGDRLIVNLNTLQQDELVEFDGSSETDGSFLFFGGHGDETLRGGRQSDGFYFGQDGFDPDRDVLHGGGGDNDQLGLQGSYVMTLTGRILDGIETVVLLGHADTRFGGSGVDANNYFLSFNDSNNPNYRPDRITINGNALGAGEYIGIYGYETEHTAFTVYGGAAADIIQGGHRNDLLAGGGGDDMLSGYIGADTMTGGAGRDVFAIIGAEDSSGVGHDVITDFDAASDYLSINNETFVRGADVRGVPIGRGTFDTDLAAAVAGKLAAGGILLAHAGTGDYAGSVFVVADMNGVAGYQSGEDVVVELRNPVNFAATGTDWIYTQPDL